MGRAVLFPRLFSRGPYSRTVSTEVDTSPAVLPPPALHHDHPVCISLSIVTPPPSPRLKSPTLQLTIQRRQWTRRIARQPHRGQGREEGKEEGGIERAVVTPPSTSSWTSASPSQHITAHHISVSPALSHGMSHYTVHTVTPTRPLSMHQSNSACIFSSASLKCLVEYRMALSSPSSWGKSFLSSATTCLTLMGLFLANTP